MIRYWKHIEKKPYHRPWLDSNVNYSSKELSSPDDSYVSMSFRKKPHVQQSRRLMDKQMQKYFDKADEALLNKQMSDRWRNLKSTFDSYMNLTVNERRRTSIANMRGYQLDKNRKILYSFEDNCAYNIKITDLFNKIEVTGKHHDFTDIEKRNIFDNPYAYTPISPYRITWPSVNVKGTADLSLVKIEQSLADVARATEGFTNTMNATMNNFTSAVNNIVATQQNAAINQNFAQEEVKEEEPGLRSKKYTEQYGLDTTVRYDVDENGNPTGLHPKANSRTRILYRGRSKYNERIDRYGWTDDGNYVWDPNTDPIPPPQPLNVTNTINQGVSNSVSLDDASIDKMANAFAARVTPYMNGTINSINQLNSVVSNMSSFDYTVNMNQLYATIVQAAAYIRTVATEASENNLKLLRDAVSSVKEDNQTALNTSLEYQRQSLLYILDTVNKKLNTANFDQCILNLSDAYQSLAKSLIKNEEDWTRRIPDITNAQHAYVDRVEEKMKAVAERVGLNQEALVSRISTQQKESMDNIQEVLLSWAQQETNTLGQILQFNSQLAAQVQNESILKQLQDIQNRVDQSLNAYQNGLEAIEDQMSNNTRMLCDSITASDGETRQLIYDAATTTNSLLTNGMQGLTNTIQDTQAQNTRMIQDGVNALGNAMTSQSEAAQQMRELEAFLMQQLGSNTQKLLDKQDYTNRLLEYNIASDDALRNKIYQAYQMLCGSPIKSQNLPAIEVEPQRQMITNDPNRTNLLLQDANEIIPAAVASEQIASQGEAALSPNVNLNMESIEYIRDQYVFFMDIMTNYITDQGLINLTKELGFNRLFNAYLQRGNNDYLMNLFIRIANHNEIKPEEYQTIRDTVNSLPITLNVDMNDIIAKTRRRVNDMWNTDSG